MRSIRVWLREAWHKRRDHLNEDAPVAVRDPARSARYQAARSTLDKRSNL